MTFQWKMHRLPVLYLNQFRISLEYCCMNAIFERKTKTTFYTLSVWLSHWMVPFEWSASIYTDSNIIHWHRITFWTIVFGLQLETSKQRTHINWSWISEVVKRAHNECACTPFGECKARLNKYLIHKFSEPIFEMRYFKRICTHSIHSQ